MFRVVLISVFLRCVLLALLCSALSVEVLSERGMNYVDEEEGRKAFFFFPAGRKPSAAEQWEQAQASYEKGHLRRAEKRMKYLFERWPNSAEAPAAARARADVLLERRKWKKAFAAYQFCMDNYANLMADYDGALKGQFHAAVEVMNQRRMGFIFGGYTAPEFAIPFFEKVLRNGPQWTGAPQAQLMVGECHRRAGNLEEAIAAYAGVDARYPESVQAEEASWQRIECLNTLHEQYPISPEILQRTLTATTVFLSRYPESKRRNGIILLRNSLYEIQAGRLYEQAAFYERVPMDKEAALILYGTMVKEFPKSVRVPKAEERIAGLRADLDRTNAVAATIRPQRARPLPFFNGGGKVDG